MAIYTLDGNTAGMLRDPTNSSRRIALVTVTYFDAGGPVVFSPATVSSQETALPASANGTIYLNQMMGAVLETSVITQDNLVAPTRILAAKWIGSGGSYRCISASTNV